MYIWTWNDKLFWCLSWTFTTQDYYWSIWRLFKTRKLESHSIDSLYMMLSLYLQIVLCKSIAFVCLKEFLYSFTFVCRSWIYANKLPTRLFSLLSLALSIPAFVLAFIILHSNSAKRINDLFFLFQQFYNCNLAIWQSYHFYQMMSYRIISLRNSIIIFGTYRFTNTFTQFHKRLLEIRINLFTGLV